MINYIGINAVKMIQWNMEVINPLVIFLKGDEILQMPER